MPDEPRAQRRTFASRAEYEDALDLLIERAQRSIQIFDTSLCVAYNSPRRQDALRRFLLSSRLNRLHIVLHDTATVDRNCPRLIILLRQFSHAVAVHCTHAEAKGAYDPFVIGDQKDCVRRFHFDDLRGEVSVADPSAVQVYSERFAELWAASDQALAATTLGL